jgi:hypothetical protein
LRTRRSDSVIKTPKKRESLTKRRKIRKGKEELHFRLLRRNMRKRKIVQRRPFQSTAKSLTIL